jgi:glycolate oxidase
VTDRRWLNALREVFPAGRLLTVPADLTTYGSDGLTAYDVPPSAVVLPEREQEVVEAVRICHRFGVPFVARGSGTGLSGGSVPTTESLVIALNRLNRVLSIDRARRLAVVEPGVWNADVTKAAAVYGLYYAPDPSSQQVCTIGGNIAFNAGGAHCLKYGMTGNHVVGIRAVLPDGEVVELGGESLESIGPGLLSLFVGSEGLLGIALRVTLRLLPKPERVRTVLAAYDSLGAAGDCVSAVVAEGLLPAAMEIMDRLAIKAAEAAVHPGYPQGAVALVIVELDGEAEQVDDDWGLLQVILSKSGATSVRVARDDSERAQIWKGRKSAFSAVGRLSPDFLVNDGVVPRTKLTVALDEIEAMSARRGLAVANVFHAGDGNLHPLVLYDGRKEGEVERAKALVGEILDMCIRLGGSITGEHGVGVEKRAYLARLYAETDVAALRRLRLAVDPLELANRGKVLPEGPIVNVAARSPAPVPRTMSPTSIEDVQQAVAGTERVLPRGGGSKTALSTPTGLEVMSLDLSGVAGIVEYEPSEFVITALAGTPIAQIDRLLAEHGQCLPFDPPLVDAGATLGGTVAAGINGSGRYRHGGVRDFVLGARFVDGEGNLIRGRGRVVKNAAGFDLPRLLTGSRGHLGVIVEVSCKVLPRPETHATVALRCSLDDGLGVIERLSLSPFDIEALDLVWLADAAYVLVRLGGSAVALPGRLERLRQVLGGGEALLAADDERTWRDAREFAWVPGGWSLTLVPITLSDIPALDRTLEASPVVRRYVCGGQAAWIASPAPAASLGQLLAGQGLSGLAVLGPPAEDAFVGRGRANELGRRVRRGLDEVGRFAGA